MSRDYDSEFPFLGHKVSVRKIDSEEMVELQCNDKCSKKQKIRIRCSLRDLKNLQASIWPEIIRGE